LERTGPIGAVAFAPDGQAIAAASEGSETLGLWDVATGKVIGRGATGHREAIRTITFALDGKMLATRGDDRTVKVWDPDGLGIRYRFSVSQASVVCVALSADGKTIAVVGGDGGLRIWRAGEGEIQRSAGRNDPEAIIRSVDFSPDGKWV